jgi:hypothetical protein
MSSGFAEPAWLKKLAGGAPRPNFLGNRGRDEPVKGAPSLAARSAGAFLSEAGSFRGYMALLPT